MMKKRTGRIVNITSVVGITGNAGQVTPKSDHCALFMRDRKTDAYRNPTCRRFTHRSIVVSVWWCIQNA